MNSCFTVSLSLSSCFFFIKIYGTEAAPNYIDHDCPNTTLITPNSTYQSNLHTLLSSLSSAATHSTDGFANATAGQNPPDRAYGLFLCRGDLDIAACSDCVATGKQDILQICPKQQVSVIWYDQCMLRYPGESIFSAMKETPTPLLYDGNVVYPIQFMQVLLGTLNDVAARVSAGGSGKKVAVAEANITSQQKLYALSQCMLDLTASDCGTCLQFGIANLPQGKQGEGGPALPLLQRLGSAGTSMGTSASAPAPAPATRPEGKSNRSTMVIIAVAVPVGMGVVLLFLACCFRRRKATKTSEAVQGDQSSVNGITKAKSLQYDLATIQAGTYNFSCQNKLGEGGFGEGFQGRLSNGQEIAVKRLSKSSGQGVGEFKNEVVLVSELQH